MRSKAPVKERVKEFLFEELKEPEKPIIEYWRVIEGFNEYCYFVKVPIQLIGYFKAFPEIAEYRDPSFRVIAKQYKLSVGEMDRIIEELGGKAKFRHA